jgi:hypothetical protein
MFSWILSLVLALLLWSLATAYLWIIQRRDTEIRHGLAALAGMRWREFSQIVRQAMADQRGLLTPVELEDPERGTSSDFLLHKDGQRCLVSCKHGRAYRFDANALSELGTAMRLTGASSGVLITEGLVDRDGLAEASKHSIEVIDERRLWQLLKPHVSEEMRETVVGIARREAVRHTGIAGLAALTIGLLAGMGYLTLRSEDSAAATEVATPLPPTAPQPHTAVAATPKASPTASTTAETSNLIADPDPETLLRYQNAVSKALARTPGVVSGIWLTRSTLLVERSGDDTAIWPLICQELERYPSLRTVRVQINPRPGVEEPVRWRQCRTF